jgi:hypothetical protein
MISIEVAFIFAFVCFKYTGKTGFLEGFGWKWGSRMPEGCGKGGGMEFWRCGRAGESYGVWAGKIEESARENGEK